MHGEHDRLDAAQPAHLELQRTTPNHTESHRIGILRRPSRAAATGAEVTAVCGGSDRDRTWFSGSNASLASARQPYLSIATLRPTGPPARTAPNAKRNAVATRACVHAHAGEWAVG